MIQLNWFSLFKLNCSVVSYLIIRGNNYYQNISRIIEFVAGNGDSGWIAEKIAQADINKEEKNRIIFFLLV
jgi:hypothetical protein